MRLLSLMWKVLCVLSFVAAAATAQLMPVGTQFTVNTVTTANGSMISATEPAVAVSPSGSFLVVWNRFDRGYVGAFARLYDHIGAPIGDEFQVSDSHGLFPVVAAAGADVFFVVWIEGESVFGQRYGSSGTAQGDAFLVGSAGTPVSAGAHVACNGTGHCVVVWPFAADGNNGIAAQRYDSSGAPAGTELQVSVDSAQLGYPHTSVDPEGNFLIVWQRFDPDVTDSAIYSQLYRADATPHGAPLRIAITGNRTGYDATGVDVAADPMGKFFVTWDSQVDAAASHFAPMPGTIFAQQLDGNGAALGSVVQITKPETYLGFFPAVASDGGPNFLLTWREITLGNTERISAQYLGPKAAAVDPSFQVTSSNRTTNSVDAASNMRGDLVVVWDSQGRILAQRYRAEIVPPVPAAGESGGGCAVAPPPLGSSVGWLSVLALVWTLLRAWRSADLSRFR